MPDCLEFCTEETEPQSPGCTSTIKIYQIYQSEIENRTLLFKLCAAKHKVDNVFQKSMQVGQAVGMVLYCCDSDIGLPLRGSLVLPCVFLLTFRAFCRAGSTQEMQTQMHQL